MKNRIPNLCFLLGLLILVGLSGCSQPKYVLTIAAGAGGTTNPSPGVQEYDKATSVSVQATAYAGFTFERWEGDATGSGNPVTVIMDANKSVTAVFLAQGEGEGEGTEGEGETSEGESSEGEGESLSWQNTANALDANDDGSVTAADALVLINDINANGARALARPPASPPPPPYLDVNGDGSISPIDVLLVINHLNTQTEIGKATNAVRFHVAINDAQGTALTTVAQGQEFWVEVFVEDAAAGAQPVFAAYLDLGFDAARVTPEQNLQFGTDYPNGHTGMWQAGQLDEAGGFAGVTLPPAGSLVLLKFKCTAAQPGEVTFTAGAADHAPASDILVYGENAPEAPATVIFGSASLTITPSGSEGEGETVEGETTEGEGEAPRELALVVDTYMGAESFSTDISPNPIAGRVVVLDSGVMPGTLHWTLKNAAGETNGDVPVDAKGVWSASLDLANGDNSLTFTVPDTPAVKTLNLTYTPGYAFGEPLYVTPDLAYVNEDREFTALITLSDPSTHPAEVKLLRYDNGAATEIATLTDTGDAASGDEMALDGIYAGKFHLNETTPGTLPLRVGVTYGNVPAKAFSEPANILVTEHWPAEQLAAISEQLGTYAARLEPGISIPAMATTCEQIALELQNDPLVEDCGVNQDSWGVWVVYKNGLKAGIAPRINGYRSGAKCSAYGEDGFTPKSAAGTSAYEAYARRTFRHDAKANKTFHPVRSKNLFAISSFYDTFGDDNITTSPEWLRNYGFSSVGMPILRKEEAGFLGSFNDYKGLGKYGLVGISTHGNIWGRRNARVVVLNSGDGLGLYNGPGGKGFAPYEDDVRQFRLLPIYFEGSSRGWYHITPAFISRYSGTFPGSLVIAAACYSAANGSMAKAFLDLGAGAYLGFSAPVHNTYASIRAGSVIGGLLEAGSTLADAFTPGQFDDELPPWSETEPPAEWRMMGDSALCFPMGLADGGFENNWLLTAWTVTGDARRVAVFGIEPPLEGKGMLMLPPGSSVSQTFFVSPNDPRTLRASFRHYFYSGGTCAQENSDGTLSLSTDDIMIPPTLVNLGGTETSTRFGICDCAYARPRISAWKETSRQVPFSSSSQVVTITITHKKSDNDLCTDVWFIDNIIMY